MIWRVCIPPKDIRIQHVRKLLCRQTRRRWAQWRLWNSALQSPGRLRQGRSAGGREERIWHERNDSWADGESWVIFLSFFNP